MEKNRWQRLSPLLDELLDLDEEARTTRLHSIDDEDAALAANLRELLKDYEALDRDRFLETSLERPLPVGLAGQVIDRYTLDRQIGEGGMGAVWLAHRSDGRFEGQVAIKFLSMPSMGSAGLQRFEREGHVLARLKHSNIAHLLDAGVTSAGQPYLVLEYVQGEHIDRWCANRQLDVRARIELFLQVLDAVSHAHGKLILHRDLKPSNILVTPEGRVKLLDFGIAKLLEEAGTPAQATEMTHLAGRVFTLDYASPEQIQGTDATTATDVYSLGVLLYVVLTGQHPTAGNATTPAERIRAVLDTEPKRPSVAVAETGERGSWQGAADRARALRGDLDNIVAKALKKPPQERYATVDAFAQDLRRYLNNEPVSARPDSFAYRLRKFVVRNALPVSAAAIVLVAIVVAAIVSLWQAGEAARQRDRALTLSARNLAVLDFVTGMLTEAAPNDEAIRVSDLLQRSRDLLLTSETDPEHQAAVLDLMAEYYLSTGNPSQAEPLLERALELVKSSKDVTLKATLLCNRGHALQLLSRFDDALRSATQGLELSRDDALAGVRCHQKRAFIAQFMNDPNAALEHAQQALAMLKASGLQRPEIAASLTTDLAYAYYLAGRTAEADRYYAEALERYTKLGRRESPATFSLRNNWGIASYAAGDNRRALENYDEALRIAKLRDPESDPPVYLLANRALALASLARYEEALQEFEVALVASERANNLASVLHTLANRAGTYLLMGDVYRAARELETIETRYGAMLAPDSVPGITIAYLKGRLELARQRPALALTALNASVAFFDERKMYVAPLTRALSARAEAHLRLGDEEKAAADARRAVEISRKLQDAKPFSSLTGASLLQAAEVALAKGQPEEARRMAAEAWSHLNEALGEAHPDAQRARWLAQDPPASP
jgi:serine/threonine protein kinase